MNFRPKKHQLLGWLPDALVQTRGSRSSGCRYLSFDDGPHPEHTPRLLDLLARHGVRASFFVVGRHAERYPGLAQRIVAEGHLLGNHSYSHQRFGQMSLDEQVQDMDRADRLLQSLDGRIHHRIRTPQGHLSLPLLRHFARVRRSIAYWCYDSLDYQGDPAPVLVERLQAAPPRTGDIVLMHDDGDSAIAALEVLLPQWLALGWQFDALEQDAA